MKKNLLILACVLNLFAPLLGQEKQASPPLPPLYSYAPIVKQVTPCVVNIFAAQVVEQQQNPLLEDPIFRHFFGDGVPGRTKAHRVQSSLGSGVIVSPDGVVITNLHVIRNAQEIKVVLSDGREIPADIVVQDKRTDLAALKLRTHEKNLPYLKLRDADELEVGDIVLAFGNPFGFGNTVTSGIISGLARSELGSQDFRSFIQTDAAINPGNSGGPLVTLDGKLVGINTAIFSNTGGSIGISFATPSNLVAPVIASVGHGQKRVIRPWIGLRVQGLTKEILETLGLKVMVGVLIQKVFDKSSAQRGGLQEGDIILKVNGHAIKNEASFRFRIATLQVGQSATFTLLRSDKEIEKTLELIASPADTGESKSVEITGRNPLAGASVRILTPSIAEDFSIPFDENKIVIDSIKQGALARLNGLQPGDIIVRINSKDVKSVEDLMRYLSRTREGWVIEYLRGQTRNSLAVQTW
jgi:Do/DeqQ family serine protease